MCAVRISKLPLHFATPLHPEIKVLSEIAKGDNYSFGETSGIYGHSHHDQLESKKTTKTRIAAGDEHGSRLEIGKDNRFP